MIRSTLPSSFAIRAGGAFMLSALTLGTTALAQTSPSPAPAPAPQFAPTATITTPGYPGVGPADPQLRITSLPNGKKMYLLPATLDTTQWGWFDNAQAPVLRVNSGDTIVLETMMHSHNQIVPGTTIEQIKKNLYWPKMNEDIENYVRTCTICQKRKTGRDQVQLTLIIREPKLFKHIGIDIMGPLPTTIRGKRYIVLAIDLFTKWIEAKAIEEADAQTISTFIYEDIICRHGIPQVITSDRGTEFVNDLISTLTEEFRIKHIKTTVYHPQGNGQTE